MKFRIFVSCLVWAVYSLGYANSLSSNKEVAGIVHGIRAVNTSKEQAPEETSKVPDVLETEGLARAEKEDIYRSSTEVVQRLRNLEQLCFDGNVERSKKIGAALDRRVSSLLWAIKPAAEKLGVWAQDPPDSYLTNKGTSWPESSGWREKFLAKKSKQKCEVIEYAYAVALARISLAPSIKPIECYKDTQCANYKSELFQKDLRRLMWELRYFTSLDSKDIPTGCKHYHDEMLERLSYATPKEGAGLKQRWVMGRAIGMCGRTMSAHYIDFKVSSNQVPTPAGYNFSINNPNQISFDDILKFESMNTGAPVVVGTK